MQIGLVELACTSHRPCQSVPPSYHSRRRSCRVSNDAASGSASLRLDFGRSDHLAPFLGFFDDELAEGGGRAHKRGFAQIRKVRLQLRSGETRIDLRIKLIDHLRRRVSGCANAEPRANLVAWHKFANRWQVRQCIGPSHCRYRQRAQLACSDVFKEVGRLSNMTCTCPASKSV